MVLNGLFAEPIPPTVFAAASITHFTPLLAICKSLELALAAPILSIVWIA